MGCKLTELRGSDTGARALLASYPEQVHLLQVADGGILLDVDHPEDLP